MRAHYLKAFFVSLPVGAVIGLAFGFATRERPWGVFAWISIFTADAIFWMFAGALVAGLGICLLRLLQSN
jgi:hypothetical protein